MAQGVVKWFSAAKGFGFIVPDGGQEGKEEDVFVHHSRIVADGFRTLAEGDRVEFTVVHDDKGRAQADQVRKLA